MVNITIHPIIVEKLRTRHNVKVDEVHECFSNIKKGFLIDTRENNQTDPVTHWFIEETDCRRRLLVAFMYFKDSGETVVKTAYEPNEDQIKTYNRLTKL